MTGPLLLQVLFSLMAGGALWAASSAVVFSSDDELCARLDQAVDTSALKAGRLTFSGPGVQSVEWQAVTLAGQAPKVQRCSTFEQARADLLDAGRPSLLIRSRFCMRGKPSDSLYVFPGESDVLTRTTWQDLGPLHETLDKFERTGGVYPLTHLSAAQGRAELRELFVVEVVGVGTRAYVALSAPPFEWIVVGRYSGRGAIQDICYLHRAG